MCHLIFLTVTAWHGGMECPWFVCVCVSACARVRWDGRADGQNKLAKRDSGRERTGKRPDDQCLLLPHTPCGNDLNEGMLQSAGHSHAVSFSSFSLSLSLFEFTRGDRQQLTPGLSLATCSCSPACWLHAWWVPVALRYTRIFLIRHTGLSSRIFKYGCYRVQTSIVT